MYRKSALKIVVKLIPAYLKALQSSDVHHFVSLVRHDRHDVKCARKSRGLVRQAGPLRVFEDGLQEHVVLRQPLDRFDQEIR